MDSSDMGLTAGDSTIKVHTLPTSFKSHYGVVAIDATGSTNGLEMISLGVHDFIQKHFLSSQY